MEWLATAAAADRSRQSRGCRAPITTEQLGAGALTICHDTNGRYVCGADPAEGLAKGDYSAAVVLDWHSGLEVAELYVHWPPEVFAQHLNDVCRRLQ